MQIAPEVRELEDLAEQTRIPISRALSKAGVSLSTYWRWRHEGAEPKGTTVRKVKSAFAELSDAGR